MRMKKKTGLMFIGLCLVISAGLVLVNFNQASFKVMAANEKALKNASSFLSEGVTYDLLAGTTASVSGNVAGRKSHAQSGVDIEVLEKGKKGTSVGTVTTCADGSYTITGLEKNNYTIKVNGKKKGRIKIKSADLGETIIKNFKSKK